jgi:hypothetical protein
MYENTKLKIKIILCRQKQYCYLESLSQTGDFERMLQKKLAGNLQLSKHIRFGKSSKTIAYRSTCYFFMLAPKEAAIETIAYRLLVIFCAKRSSNQNNSLPFCLLLFYALRQKKRQSKTIPFRSACYFLRLRQKKRQSKQ